MPLTTISGSEDVAFRPVERVPTILRTTLFAHPNILLRLAEPLVHRGRRIEAIAMRLDEPAAFASALTRRLERMRAAGNGPNSGLPDR